MAYLVTGFGVLWSMLLLDERYSALVWVAFAILIAGIALVQPKAAEAVPVPGPAPVPATEKDT